MNVNTCILFNRDGFHSLYGTFITFLISKYCMEADIFYTLRRLFGIELPFLKGY